jgi:hypothetical protein
MNYMNLYELVEKGLRKLHSEGVYFSQVNAN